MTAIVLPAILSFLATAVPASTVDASPYPGSKVIANLTVGNGTVEQATLTTGDSIDAVLTFYEALFGQKLRADCGHGPDPQGRITTASNDSYQGGQAPRPVEVRVLTQSTPDHVLTVTITRAEGEPLTHIVLVLVRKG